MRSVNLLTRRWFYIGSLVFCASLYFFYIHFNSRRRGGRQKSACRQTGWQADSYLNLIYDVYEPTSVIILWICVVHLCRVFYILYCILRVFIICVYSVVYMQHKKYNNTTKQKSSYPHFRRWQFNFIVLVFSIFLYMPALLISNGKDDNDDNNDNDDDDNDGMAMAAGRPSITLHTSIS